MGWYEDMIDSMRQKHEDDEALNDEIRRQQDNTELDEDGCYPDGSRDDEPGPGMG